MKNSSIYDGVTLLLFDPLTEGCEFVADQEEIEELMNGDLDRIKIKAFGREYTGEEFATFAEEVENSHLDAEVFVAYIAGTGCNLDCVSDCEEAFSGEFANDVDFAQDMADQIGMEKNVAWPYTCIDWEMAARELMYDYFEQDGYYFRNL